MINLFKKKRAQYKPTARCKDLMQIFISLSLWSNKWFPDPRRPQLTGIIGEDLVNLDLEIIPLDETRKLNNKVKLSLSTIK